MSDRQVDKSPQDSKESSSSSEKQVGQVNTKFRDIDFGLVKSGDNKKNKNKNKNKGGNK